MLIGRSFISVIFYIKKFFEATKSTAKLEQNLFIKEVKFCWYKTF